MLIARDLGVAPPGAHTPVLRGVNLDVAPGEWLAVTGRNGCGKTSLALTIAGLLQPCEGTLTWCGRRPGARGASDSRGAIGAILQDPSAQLLQPTVELELAFTGANVERDPAELARDLRAALAEFGLERERANDPRSLSAGRQQIVLALAALLARPGLLVADEAAAHLDATSRSALLARLRAETKRGLAIVWVTQSETECGWADRVLRLGEEAASPRTPPPERAVNTDPRPELVRVRIAGPPTDSGPRVETGTPFEIVIPTAGVVALSGPNGAGKSVLLQALAGLLDLPQVSVAWRLELPQRPLLVSQYPEQQIFEERVADELVFAAKSRGRDGQDALADASRMLDAMGLSVPGMLSARSWGLSSGEKRIIEVIAALVAPTGLLLLDEPTAGLDPVRAERLAALVRQRAADTAIVVAGQDLEWNELLGGRHEKVGEALVIPASTGEKTD